MAKVSVCLPDELHRRLKMMAAERNSTIQELACRSIENIFAPASGQPPMASMTKTEKRALVSEFKQLLDIGDAEAAIALKTLVEATELLLRVKHAKI